MAQTEHNPETIEQRDLGHSPDQAPRDAAEMAVLYDVALWAIRRRWHRHAKRLPVPGHRPH
jgi:hypothetical protein